ncbi:MAG: PAS domain S-box protein [Desulfobacterales bacterium]
MKVLIVDDNKENRILMEALLKGDGHNTILSSNGAEAIEKLRSEQVDMIISDIFMPVMDGFQLCRICKGNETLKKILFVFYTATYVDDEDETFAYSVGADRFLRKPLEPDAFLKVIRELVQEAGAGKIEPREPVEREEKETFKLYSERLVKKLEKKMQDLESELAHRKQNEKEIWKLSMVVEQSPSVVMITDIEGKIEYVNPKFEELTGYTAGEVFGTNTLNLGEQLPEETGKMFSELNSGRVWQEEFQNRKKNGEKYWEAASIFPIFDAENRITQFVKFAEDITEKRERERELQQERFRMDTILSVLDTGLSLINRDMTIAWVNQKTRNMFSNRETLGQICHVFYEDSNEICDSCPTLEVFKTGKAKETIRFNSNTRKWYHVLSQPVKDKNDNVTQVLEAITDITAKKMMEDALKKNEERFNFAIEASDDGLWDYNFQTGESYFSPRYYTMLGFEPYELPQAYETWSGLLHPEDRESVETRILDHIDSNNAPFEQEFRLRTKSGQWKWVLGRGKVFFRNEAGRPVRIVGTHTDISRLKETEQLLRESEVRYRNIIEVSPAGIIVHSDGKLVFTNKAGSDLMGAGSPAEIIGMPIKEILHPDNWNSARERLQRMLAGEKILHPVEERLVRLDGKTVDVFVTDTKLTYEGRPAVQVVIQDITEKKKIERELRVWNEITQIFLTSSDDTVYDKVLALILDSTRSKYGMFGFINKEGAWVCPSLTSDVWEQCRIPDKKNIFPHEQWGGLWGKAMVERKSQYSKKTFSLPEGHITIDNALAVPIIYRNSLIGNFLVGQSEKGYEENDIKLLEAIATYIAPILSARLARDMEERDRKKVEDRLRRAQKMEAIGTLAGGIAHDFNNILSAIIGFTQLAMNQIPADSPVLEDLKEVLTGAERARNLVKQILAFSRQQEEEISLIQVAPVLKETINLLRSTLPTSIEIRQKIEPEVGSILADPTQIHQVIMNLCTNAGYAMREQGGTLELRLTQQEVDDDSADKPTGLRPGEYIRLSVSDTGQGIAPEVLNKVFDPYFTTKSRGEGTGLGLSMVHGIVETYGGVVSVYSELKKGTIFHVYLPVIQEDIKSETFKLKQSPGGDERILFVDDETPIVKAGKRILEELGYRVETKTSPTEALELFRTHPDQFDLVITDMTMPGMTGDRLSQEVMNIRPDIPVILCTGFSEKITKKNAKDFAGVKAFLMKPFSKDELAFAIRKVIGGIEH